jgi:hypothetical protein
MRVSTTFVAFFGAFALAQDTSNPASTTSSIASSATSAVAVPLVSTTPGGDLESWIKIFDILPQMYALLLYPLSLVTDPCH